MRDEMTPGEQGEYAARREFTIWYAKPTSKGKEAGMRPIIADTKQDLIEAIQNQTAFLDDEEKKDAYEYPKQKQFDPSFPQELIYFGMNLAQGNE